VSRGFFIIYLSASAAWLASLFISPVLGVLLGLPAAYGFLKLAEGFDSWSLLDKRVSYEVAGHASRAGAVAVAVVALGAETWLSVAETWLVRLALYGMWSGLWILYYYVLQAVIEETGAKLPVTAAALGFSILLSPLLTEALPAAPEVKLVLAASLYAGYMPPLNVSALLAALLTRK